ncbi:hypothetical protein J4457_07095 [Candidatus Woesearchaeota archaeon]|nr:hypothetical protein [Candidatus Woesearchaeota archaeon]
MGADPSQQQVTISYETLYDILRNEKLKFELQNLPVDFFSQVLRYLESQLMQIQQSKYKGDLFSSTERSKTEMQLHNAKKMLRELYERRERKIIDMAINKSRTNSAIIDTEALLHEEMAFFETLVMLFNRYRDGVLNNIFQLKHPLIAMAEQSLSIDDFEMEVKSPLEIEKAFETPRSVVFDKKDYIDETGNKKVGDGEIIRKIEENITEQNEEITENPERKTIFQELREEQHQNKKISENAIPLRFLKTVERFVDENLNYYGPFTSGDSAEIPHVVAEILLEQGKAERK